MKMKLHRLLALLMTLIMLLGMVPSSALADAANSNSNSITPSRAANLVNFELDHTPKNLSPFVTSYVDSTSGSNTSTGLMSSGLKVSYHMDPSDVYYASGDTAYLYDTWVISRQDLGLDAWSESMAKSGSVYVTGTSSPIGTYEVVGNNIKIVYKQSFLEVAATGDEGVTGAFSVSGSWYLGEDAEDGKIEIKVGETTHIVYPYGQGDLSVTKTKGTYDFLNREMTWTIKVKSTKGTWGPVNVTDYLPNVGYNASLTGNLRMEVIGYTVSVADPSVEGADEYTYSEAADGRSVSIKNLPQLAAGQEHTITITTKLFESALTADVNYLKNLVKVDSLQADGTKLEASDTDQFDDFKRGDVSKGGSYAYDRTNGVVNVNWTITVNTGKQPIDGMILKDQIWPDGTNSYTNFDLATATNLVIKKGDGSVATPGVDYTFEGGNIKFLAKEGGNKSKYVITYTTEARELASGDKGTYVTRDQNKALLYDGSKQVAASEKKLSVKESDANWMDKTATFDKTNRIATFTITINTNRYNMGNVTQLLDQWKTSLPAGGGITFVENSGSYKVNGGTAVPVTSTTVQGVMDAVLAKIQQDTKNGVNMNKYVITYKVAFADDVTGSYTNTAKIEGTYISESDDAGTGEVGVYRGTKSASAELANGRAKWTITLNDNKVSTTGWTFSDTLHYGDGAILANPKTAITVVNRNNKSTTTYHEFTNVSQLNTYVTNNLTTTWNQCKITIVYYSAVNELTTVKNDLTLNGKTQSVTAPFTFTPGIAKSNTGENKIEGQGYEVNWNLNVTLGNFEMGSVPVVIEDDLTTTNHYMTLEQIRAAEAAARDAFSPAEISFKPKGGENGRYTGFRISLFHTEKFGSKNFQYSTFVPLESYAGTVTNKSSVTIVDNGTEVRKESVASYYPHTDLHLNKEFLGESTVERIRWQLSYTPIHALNGNTYTLTDQLPAGIEPTAISIREYRADGSNIKTNINSAIGLGSSTSGEGYAVSVSNSGKITVTVSNAGYSNECAEVRIVVTAKCTQNEDGEYPFLADAANGSKSWVNTANLTVKDRTATDSASTDIPVPEVSYPPVTKGGVVSASNTATYTITLNKGGKQLLSEPGGTLDAVDVLSWNTGTGIGKDAIKLVSGSISLTDKDGNAVSGWSYTKSEGNLSGSTASNRIDLKIPDGKELILTYSYFISTAAAQANFKLTNTISLNGIEYEGRDDSEVYVDVIDNASFDASTTAIVFYKAEEGNFNVVLPGVNFVLYEYTSATKYKQVATGVSDATGKVNFTFSVTPAGIKTKTPYRLHEVSAPEGYTTGDDLIFSVDTPSFAVSGCKTYGVSANAYIENEPEKTEIKVKKVWAGDYTNTPVIRVQVKDASTSSVVETVELSSTNGYEATVTGLRKYAVDASGKYIRENGELVPIQYTVSEIPVAGYDDLPIQKAVENGVTVFTITNTKIITIEGSKTWDDNNNQDGLRPASITITLLANGKIAKDQNGKEIAAKTVTANDNWAWSFTNLPEHNDAGTKIVYTVEEGAVTGYTATYPEGTYNVTNKHVPEVITLSGSKTWNDNNNQDGLRPASITINLLADGTQVDSKTVTEKDNWTWKFENLPKFKAGKEITYTITEAEVKDYKTTINGYDVTNKHVPEVITLSGSKTWNDNNNQDGLRPESIVITLKANGEIAKDQNGNEIAAKTVTANDGWTWKFENLPKFKAGKEITYTITEDKVEGYETTINGYNVTNKHVPEVIELSGSKTWNDNNNQDGLRPESIVITLKANGKIAKDQNGNEVAAKTVTANDGWTWKFENLPKFEAGKQITYTVVEEAVDGYKTSYPTGTIDVINSNNPSVITLNGKKTWDDNNNQDGIRPTKITINLLANGEAAKHQNGNDVAAVEATADTNWAWSFTNLPKFKAGKEITYTITEDKVEGYETTINGYDVTNKHVPEVIELSGSKTWNDNNNQDGLRPESIVITLKANGKIAKDQNGNEVAAKTVTANDGWTWKFENLPKFEAGEKIIYTVVEEAVDGYETSYPTGTIDVINSNNPSVIALNGKKTWDDNNNQDGLRPESITITLKANGEIAKDQNGNEIAAKTVTANDNWAWSFTNLPEFKNGKKIIYTVVEEAVDGYKTSYPGGINVTNEHVPSVIDINGIKTWDDCDNQDGIRPSKVTVKLWANGKAAKHQNGNDVAAVEATADTNWKWSFTNLPEFKNGKKIIYTVTEDAVPGYEAKIDNKEYHIENCYTPVVIALEGSKTWNDNNNQDGLRPESIVITLKANGGTAYHQDKTEVEAQTVTPDGEGNWKWTFTNLPKFKDGKEIAYTVEETAVGGYTASYPAGSINVVNEHTPSVFSLSGSKTWNDNNNQDGLRPGSITIKLLANGGTAYHQDKTEVEAQTVTPDGEGNWKWTFDNLPKFKDGVEIAYTVEETTVGGYTASYPTGSINVVNEHVPSLIKIEGSKTWDDNNNQDGVRPTEIIIRLLADNTAALDQDGNPVAAYTATADTNWAWKFENLPEFKNGKKIVYSITEETVPGYETTINTYDVTNKHVPEVITVEGSKTWNDNNNQDGVRPAKIYITLLADGEQAYYQNGTAVDIYEATADNNWAWSFTNLPKFKDGEKIAYTITEAEVKAYETTINGYDVTNKHVPEVIKLSGSKTWDDNNNQDGIRPTEINITLKANNGQAYYQTGEPVETFKANVDNGFAWTFENLPKYKNGEKIIYTVVEEAVEGYEASYPAGINVTNYHKPEEIALSGSKTWDDNNNQDGIRPTKITINLLANGKEAKHQNGNDVAAVEATADTNWAWSFTNLPKYENGEEIIYTVVEKAVDGYETSYPAGINVTNYHKPEEITLSGSKTWDDWNNQDGIRPAMIEITLKADGGQATYQNGTVVETFKATEENGFAWTFEGLPKYKNGGVEIVYTVEEKVVEGYETSYPDGIDVTNKHVPEVVSFEGSKTWSDNNDQDGLRPEKIYITLMADGEQATYQNGDLVEVFEATEDTGWAWEFENLPKYKVGKVRQLVNYSIVEAAVEGYETTITDFDVDNYHKPEEISISGNKEWIDNDDEPGKRPSTVTIRLLADGQPAKHQNGDPVAAAVASEDNDWSWTFTNLPKYRDHGTLIIYTLTEDKVDDYNAENGDKPIITGSAANGFEVTNTISQEYIEVAGTKTWIDPRGTQHAPITINLFRDGDEIDEIVLENGVTSYAFDNLPVYAVPCKELEDYEGDFNGHIFTYTVSEEYVPGYTMEQRGNNFINTIEQEWISVTVTKIWADKGAEDVVHPTITVHLFRDGSEIDMAQLNNGTTRYTFGNLPKYNLKTGQIYKYTITEDPVEGYTSVVDHHTITNTSEGPEYIRISGTKTWSGDADLQHFNETEVKLTLKRKIAGGAYEVVNAQPEWNGNTYAYKNLLKADEAGNIYQYKVEEAPVEGYETVYNGLDITNRKIYEVDYVSLSGNKYWNDNDNTDGVRPTEIVVQLLRDGKVVDAKTISEADDWKYSFTDLPDNDGYGHYYQYSVSEQLVAGYYLKIDGTDLYNNRIKREKAKPFQRLREEELEELVTILDYEVPLWGALLGTGDEVPVYPFVLGGTGMIALAAFFLLNRKRKRG